MSERQVTKGVPLFDFMSLVSTEINATSYEYFEEDLEYAKELAQKFLVKFFSDLYDLVKNMPRGKEFHTFDDGDERGGDFTTELLSDDWIRSKARAWGKRNGEASEEQPWLWRGVTSSGRDLKLLNVLKKMALKAKANPNALLNKLGGVQVDLGSNFVKAKLRPNIGINSRGGAFNKKTGAFVKWANAFTEREKNRIAEQSGVMGEFIKNSKGKNVSVFALAAKGQLARFSETNATVVSMPQLQRMDALFNDNKRDVMAVILEDANFIGKRQAQKFHFLKYNGKSNGERLKHDLLTPAFLEALRKADL